MTARDFVLLIGVCAMWALNTVVSALVVAPGHLTPAGVPPLFYAALRFGLVTLVTAPWLFPAPRPSWRIVAVGLLMGGLSFGLLFVGLRTAAPGAAGIVSQIGVPASTVLSILVLGEQVRWRRWLGIVLSLAGVVIVMWNPHSLRPSTGLLLVAAGACASSLGAVMMKQTEGVKPLQFQAWVGAASFPVMVAATAVAEHGQLTQSLAGGWGLAAAVIYSALAVSVGAHTAYFGLIQRYEQTLIAPLTLMGPLMTVALGVILTGEQLGPRLAIGSVVALAGVLVIVLRRNHVAPLAILLSRLRA